MYHRFLFLIILVAGLFTSDMVQATPPAPAGDRQSYNFNPGWELFVGDAPGAQAPTFDDSSWKNVTLPHAWNEDAAFEVSIEKLPTGIAWYRKHFKLPAMIVGSRAILEFQGIRQAGEFFVNGKPIGTSENGVMAFGLDITAALNPAGEDNVIAARIDNSWSYREKSTHTPFQWNDRNFYANYGGINKNVLLHILPPLHQTLPLFSNLGTTGVYIYASDIDIPNHAATITAEAQVSNSGPAAKTFGYQVSIADINGHLVKTFTGASQSLKPGGMTTVSASVRLGNLNFWSWGYGYLYTVTTTLTVDGKPVDSVRTRTGFRKTEFDHGEVRLNDRVLQVHGYAQRTTNEWPALGTDIPPWVSDFSNGLMVEGNANVVRWMHVTPSKQDVESCDRVGLIEAMPAGDSEGDTSGRRWEQRVELMRDAIVYNRNNPSILFYECGNHGISEAHMRQMLDVRNQYDPHGGRAMGAREMLGSKLAEYGGEMLYIDKSASKPLWAMEYSRDEGLRAFADAFTWPFHKDGDGPLYRGKPAPEYNHNQDSMAVEDVRRWFDYWHERPGTGERVSAGGVNIVFSDTNTHHRGAASYRTSGEVDAMRLPKDGFFADHVMWNGWVNPRPAIHIIGHWNYQSGTVKDVYVVSSANRVELRLNGKSLGAGEQSSRFLFTFKNVHWQPGTLEAIGYRVSGLGDRGSGQEGVSGIHPKPEARNPIPDAHPKPEPRGPIADAKLKGDEICEDTIVTTGPAVALKLTPHTRPGGMRADGSDLALVDVEAVDAQGRRVPTAFNDVTFNLTGPAEWRGGIAAVRTQNSEINSQKSEAGSPKAQFSVQHSEFSIQNSILAQTLPLELGVNRVSVRSMPQAGTITLNATAEGLKPAMIQLTTQPVQVIDGLSTAMPDDGLVSPLQRGPTPPGDSVIVTRTPVRIGRVTAGSNTDKARLAIDDDETTSWSSDSSGGGAGNSWIRFEFDKPSRVSEVELKLGGWRTRSYPIRILVDDKVVFTGRTPRSLGYVTLDFPPAVGKTLTIESAGRSSDHDAFAGITELSRRKDSDSGRGEGKLDIVEAEIYGNAER